MQKQENAVALAAKASNNIVKHCMPQKLGTPMTMDKSRR